MKTEPPVAPGVDWTLDHAGVADAQQIAQLGARLFDQTYGPANDPAVIAAYLRQAFSPDRQSALLADPDRVAWLVRDSDRVPIAYAMIRRDSESAAVVARHPAEIERLYVDAPYHGRRVGAALMSACLEQARAWHRDSLWLGVWSENSRAIAFYEKYDFRTVGTHSFVLGEESQTDLVMARDLLPAPPHP